MNEDGRAACAEVRILLAEANPLVVSALTAMLSVESDLELVGTTDRGSSILSADPASFDVAVFAWDLADMKAPKLLQELRKRETDARTVIFSNSRDISVLKQAVRLGVHGFCFQHDEPKVLIATLRAVASGRICIPYTDISRINDTPLSSLTVRERELLDVLSKGWTNQQIANRTGISENTVKYHLKNLYEKLDVRNRAMAVAVWTRESDA